MNILEKIKARKLEEVAEAEIATPVSLLQQQIAAMGNCYSLKKAFLSEGTSGIIAEFKRRSPSKGWIRENADVTAISSGYASAGAAAISVLTDQDFFGGSLADLRAARVNQLPILRKDFIVAPYQVYETRALGADIILLIAACLTPPEVKTLAKLAKETGLEVLIELHDESELEHICAEIDFIGINNRNLKTFEVDIHHALRLAEKLPADAIKIAESGIESLATILRFKSAGYKGFLMGEQFMKQSDPGSACADLVTLIRNADSKISADIKL